MTMYEQKTPSPGNRQRGLALVSVLWVMALVTLVATGLTHTIRTDSRAVGNTLQLTRAQWAAEGGVEIAALNLLYPVTARWPADGSVREVDFDDMQLRIATWDVSGRIDLNAAPPALLANLVRQAGLDDNEAAYLADAILDWRDADDMRHLNGVEAADYRIAGYDYEPRNAPFQSTEELRLVLGMTDTVYEKIAPVITVYSGQPGINLLVASPQAISATDGLEHLRSAVGGSTFDIEVEAVTEDGFRYQSAATIRMRYDGGGRPYSVLQWRIPGSKQ